MTIKINDGNGKDYTITASKQLLNLLSSALYTTEEAYKERGYDSLAEMYGSLSDSIYNALDNTGYYNH